MTITPGKKWYAIYKGKKEDKKNLLPTYRQAWMIYREIRGI
jgi:hypothetical protein